MREYNILMAIMWYTQRCWLLNTPLTRESLVEAVVNYGEFRAPPVSAKEVEAVLSQRVWDIISRAVREDQPEAVSPVIH